MKASLLAVFGILLAPPASQLNAEEAKGEEAKWHRLEEGAAHHSDFTLKPGETKDFKVASKVPIIVGFRTDITADKAKEIKGGEHPVRLSVRRGGDSMASAFGAAMTFKPTRGSLAMQIKNGADIPVRILIYTKAAPPGDEE